LQLQLRILNSGLPALKLDNSHFNWQTLCWNIGCCLKLENEPCVSFIIFSRFTRGNSLTRRRSLSPHSLRPSRDRSPLEITRYSILGDNPSPVSLKPGSWKELIRLDLVGRDLEAFQESLSGSLDSATDKNWWKGRAPLNEEPLMIKPMLVLEKCQLPPPGVKTPTSSRWKSPITINLFPPLQAYTMKEPRSDISPVQSGFG